VKKKCSRKLRNVSVRQKKKKNVEKKSLPVRIKLQTKKRSRRAFLRPADGGWGIENLKPKQNIPKQKKTENGIKCRIVKQFTSVVW